METQTEEIATDIERIELGLMLEAIYQRYGYDFREYSRASLVRRITSFIKENATGTFLQTTERLLRDPDFFYRLLPSFSVSFTALFRDPAFYAALREQVVPRLRAWPHFKIWHAGCATGEEVYSMSILLKEAGIYERATLYATDLSDSALQTGRTGIYSLDAIQRGSQNYMHSGGTGTLSNYYHAHYDAAAMSAELKKRITFAPHNLVMDKSFGEMQVVVCRNVLIYFNRSLQDQVLQSFWETLEHGGLLCLGDKETLAFSSVADRFQVLDAKNRIYKKKVC